MYGILSYNNIFPQQWLVKRNSNSVAIKFPYFTSLTEHWNNLEIDCWLVFFVFPS